MHGLSCPLACGIFSDQGSNPYAPHCKVKSESESCSVVSNSLQPHGLYSPWNSPGQNTGVDSLSLLQGIFPTQGSNPGLLHCRWILYQLNHKRSPRILEWVAYPFSRGSSRSRNQTGISCIAVRFFTNWAVREACIARQILNHWTTKEAWIFNLLSDIYGLQIFSPILLFLFDGSSTSSLYT